MKIRSRWWPAPLLILLSCGPVPPATSPGASEARRFQLQAVAPLAIVAVSADSAVAGLPPARLADGNQATEWTNGPYKAATSWAAVDLGRAATLASVAIKTGPTAAGAAYDLQASNDGSAWTTVLAGQRNTTWGMETKTLPAGTAGRRLRVFWRNNPAAPAAHFSIFELVVNGTASGSPAPTPLPTATPAPQGSPTAFPSAAPTPAPTPSGTAPVGATILVRPDRVLHATTGHVLGTVRNHVKSSFGNAAAQLAKLRELRPTWGSDSFVYRMGHGPTDGRYDYANMVGFHFASSWGLTGPYPYDDIRHYLDEAQAMGADPFHVINFGTGTAEEAARYVSYLNHAGDANRLRYPNANTQPTRLFELGNEISWIGQRGHPNYAPNETVYAQRARTFAQQMRAASDVPIQIGAVATTNSSWTGNGWSGGATTVKNILTTMGDQVDFLTFHGYPSWPVANYSSVNLKQIMAQNEWNRQKIENEIKPAIRQYAGGRSVWIANTEFMVGFYGDATRARGMFGALYTADSIALAFNQDIRLCPVLGLDHEEAADDALFFGDDPARPTAIFKLERMIARHWGDLAVASSGSGIPAIQVAGVATNVTLPRLGFAAAKSGDRVFVMVINRLNDLDVTARVDVGFQPSSATAYELSAAAGWDAANADEIVSTSPNLGAYRFKRASVTIFEVRP